MQAFRKFLSTPGFLLGYFVALLVAFVPTAFINLRNDDELGRLSEGLRMVGGDLIYRDFFELITPFAPAFGAAVLAISGPTVVAPRLAQGALLVVTGFAMYALGRRMDLPRAMAVLPGLAFAFILFQDWPVFSHHWLVTPFVTAALLAAFLGIDDGGRRWWAVAGVACAGAVLTMQSTGLAHVATVGVVIAATGLLGGSPWSRVLWAMGVFLIGLAVPLLGVAAYFYARGALGALWEDVWVFPTSQYRSVGNFNDVPFGLELAKDLPTAMPLQRWYQRAYLVTFPYLLMALMPLVALAWGCDAFYKRFRFQTFLSPADLKFGTLGLATLAAFAVLIKGRADFTHVLCELGFPFLFATVLAYRWASHFPDARNPLLRALPTVALAGFVAVGTFQYLRMVQALWPELRAGRTLDKAVYEDPLMRWAMAHTKPGDRLVAFPNGGVFYFYGRPSATRHFLLFPNSEKYTSPTQFKEAFDDIANNRPKFVILTNMPWGTPSVDNEFSRAMPAGYRLVHQMRTRFHFHPAYIYQRIDT